MASVEKRIRNGRTRWYARWLDPTGAPRSRTFDRKLDAERFLTTVESSKLIGAYVDPKQAARSFADVAEQHWAAHAHTLAADTTRPTKRTRLDRHILPVLGHHPVGAIRPSTMAAAIATWSRTLAPGTVGQTLRQVRQILDAALADGLIASNPAKAVKPPTPPRRRDVHLTDEDVAAVLAATPGEYRALVVALAGLGLRISEACGLLVSDVDFMRRVVRVRQQRRPDGTLGQLKTEASSREIPAVDQVLEALAEQTRMWPRRDGLLFSTAAGRPLSKSVAGHLFDRLEVAAGLTVSPHSLRHYFGASLISGGTSVVAVSRWLGHSSPEITWRVYSYLMPSDDEVGRAAMTETMRRLVPDVYQMCTDEALK
ncbi:tyrosine-type recombinase/integrase [uncultured Jatrophihabitans sp.]|uniref:tyrosine-type recombinase/integrase n=1 Tax=uncultured Jatrophihabitans sp. TaxID=1610747 RepID=UPI0035C9A8EF